MNLGLAAAAEIRKYLPTSQDLCARSHFFASGLQFCSNVIGASALGSSVLMRKRPSGRRRTVAPVGRPRRR